MKLEVNDFEFSKSVRLQEIDARIEHCKAEYEYWLKEYHDTGDRFTQGMVNVTFDIWQDYQRLRSFISKPCVICQPRHIFQFPKLDTRG